MTTTTDQELNFSNYFTSVNNSTELENKKKKASRACLHCQRVIFFIDMIFNSLINRYLCVGSFNL